MSKFRQTNIFSHSWTYFRDLGIENIDWEMTVCAHLFWRKFKSQKTLHNFWYWFLALFTKPIKNWGVPEMIYCKFLLQRKNCMWNWVMVMVKNGQKMAEIILGANHMLNNNILNIFSFSTFSFGYFFDPVF